MVAILGVGTTRFTQKLERTIVSLGIKAARLALSDAGLAPAQIDGAFVANALGGMLFGDTTIGQTLLREVGLRRLPVVNVENACTSGSSALSLA